MPNFAESEKSPESKSWRGSPVDECQLRTFSSGRVPEGGARPSDAVRFAHMSMRAPERTVKIRPLSSEPRCAPSPRGNEWRFKRARSRAGPIEAAVHRRAAICSFRIAKASGFGYGPSADERVNVEIDSLSRGVTRSNLTRFSTYPYCWRSSQVREPAIRNGARNLRRCIFWRGCENDKN